MKKRLKGIFRTLIPRVLLCGLRAGWILAHDRGQSRTDPQGLIVDSQGRHLPWITYPAMDFLTSLDLRGLEVYEYGSGSSTLFWLEHEAKVTGVDHDQLWQQRVQEILGPRANIAFRPEVVPQDGTAGLPDTQGGVRTRNDSLRASGRINASPKEHWRAC